MLKCFLQYYKPYKKILFLLLVGSLVRAGLELLFPYLIKQLFEQQLPLTNLKLLCQWALILLVLYLASFGIHFLVDYKACYMSAAMERDMRRDLFWHVQQQSFSFFDQNKVGQLVARLTGDLGEVGNLASRGPIDVVVCGLNMLGTIVILLWLNPFLGSVIAALLLFKTVHTVVMNQRMKKAFYANRMASGELSARATESISGIRLVKAFAMEQQEQQSFLAKAQEYLTVCSKSFRLRAYFMGSMLFFSNFINLSILLVGGILINQGRLSFGELVAFFLYVSMFMKPLMQLLGFSELYQRGMAGFRRFYELMRQKPEIIDADHTLPMKNCRGELEFRNVSFAYGTGRPVLKNVSFKVSPGEKIAFVGATGAGKTTIASLLLRFYEVQQGSILLDGVDIRQYAQRDLRQQIGLVQQDVFLFGTSVYENILYGKPDASEDQVKRAAASAAAEEFITRLPEGYATQIGERGVKLSGGQKQRLALARVFLKNPPVVVFDEATSALDTLTEKQIQQELEKLAVGRTTIVIAHRLSTIKNADKILVLADGAVVEAGTHEELLARRGRYFHLYKQE